MAVTKQIGQLWKTVRGMQRRIDTANLTLVAAGGAFFAMLAVFPGLAAVITLVGFVTDPAMVEEQMGMLAEFVPPDAYEILATQIERMVTTSSSTLGWATAVSTVAALWSARKGTDALMRGLNAVYGGPSRGGIQAALLSFALTVALSLVVIVALLALVVVPLISTVLSLPVLAENLPPEVLAWTNGMFLEVLRWIIALGVVFSGIWLLYRFSPNVPRDLTGFFTPGVILAVAVWAGATLAFSYYISEFGNYSEVYGSIGAVVALLMFLYLTIFAVLLGAALNAELDPQVTPLPEARTADDAASATAAVAVPQSE